MSDLRETVANAIAEALNESGIRCTPARSTVVAPLADAAIDALLNELIAEWSRENGNLDLYDDEGRHWSVAAWLCALKKNAREADRD